jgi:hypothetical protein
MTNGKLLTTKGQPSAKLSGVSTMTKFRTEQIMKARLTVRDDLCVFWQVVNLLPDRQRFQLRGFALKRFLLMFSD